LTIVDPAIMYAQALTFFSNISLLNILLMLTHCNTFYQCW